MARPTKLTPDLQEDILRALRAGATIESTCDSVGIGVSTFYMWVAVGEAYRDKQPHDKMPRKIKDREALSEFSEQVTRAKANGLIHATVRFREGMNPSQTVSNITETVTETRLRTVKKPDGSTEQVPYEHTKTTNRRMITDSPGDWRAAMEYLARRDPEHWARQTIHHEHTGKDGKPIEATQTHVNIQAETAHDASDILQRLADLGAIPPTASPPIDDTET